MKKIGFPIVICALLLAASGFSQVNRTPYLVQELQKQHSVQLKSGMAGSYPQHTEEFNWATDWVLYRVIETSYEDFGEPEIIVITQNSGKTKELYSYNEKQLLTKLEKQNFTGGIWVKDTQERSSYNAAGYETEYVVEAWSGSAWVTQSGRQMAYTMDGNRVMVVVGKEWDPDTQAWINSWRETYTYSGSGTNFATVVMESWDTQWVNSSKMEYTWTGAEITQVIIYEYENSDWKRSAKFVYEIPDASTTVFTMYGDDGAGGWDPATRLTSHTDSHGNLTLEVTEMYSGTWMVFASTRYTLTYSGNNLTQRITEESSLMTGNVWNKTLKEVFSNFASLSANISALPEDGITVFPNPTGKQATVRLSLLKAGSVTLQVVSMTGQRIREETFTANGSDINYLLDLSEVQPGSYLLIARDRDGNEIGKTRLIRVRD
jgi:hypothetical protein